MRFWFTYPLTRHPYDPAFVERGTLVRIVRAAEAAGFDGVGFTEHPAPSHKWLTAGGHPALDPFAALGLVAGVTDRLRLIPNIVVLPYRNPFLVAKAAATLDALSGGRFVLSVATGYLRGEYRALGVDFERRNELFDEALAVLRGVWAHDEFAFDGIGFTASGVSAHPKPAGRLPIWIGGNSALTRQRVARHGDGWNPFPAPAQLARTTRTPPVAGLTDLLPLLADLWRRVEEAGRERGAVEVSFTTCVPGPGEADFDAARHLEALAAMDASGISWSQTAIPGDSPAAALEAIEAYGSGVIQLTH